MAINKNFVVKNGLEVKSNLIVADSDTNKVGIGTTSADYKLHVIGGIGATDVVVSSALTATVADIGDLTVNGIGATTLIVSGISTFTGAIDANGDLDVDGHTELDNLRVSGVSTFVGVATFQGSLYVGGDLYVADDIFYDEVSGRNLNISGIGTIANLISTTINSTDIDASNINITGVGTFVQLNATNFETTGVTTLSSSGGITTTGGDLYVGQDLYFNGDLYQNGEIFASGVGIQTGDNLVGYGATFIEFRGPGVSTGYYDSSVGIATIFFQGGGGGAGAIGIGSTFPGTPASTDPDPSNGDLFYHIDYGRTFIYYDEAALGVGISTYWVDSSPFNIGIITALSGGVAFSDGSALSPSWYFEDDIKTGVFSPTNGELTFVSIGSSVLNINSNGVVVTGVTTSTKANIGAATTFPEDLVVEGNARVTGILTIGTSSINLDGTNNNINVGSGVTIDGNYGNIAISGIITAASFVGDGSGLSGAGSTVADDTSTDATFYPVITQTTNGTITASKVSTTKLSFNPSSGTLNATTFAGSLSGTATTATNATQLETTRTINGISFDGTSNIEVNPSTGAYSNGYGTRTIQSGGSASGGSDGDIYYIY